MCCCIDDARHGASIHGVFKHNLFPTALSTSSACGIVLVLQSDGITTGEQCCHVPCHILYGVNIVRKGLQCACYVTLTRVANRYYNRGQTIRTGYESMQWCLMTPNERCALWHVTTAWRVISRVAYHHTHSQVMTNDGHAIEDAHDKGGAGNNHKLGSACTATTNPDINDLSLAAQTLLACRASSDSCTHHDRSSPSSFARGIPISQRSTGQPGATSNAAATLQALPLGCRHRSSTLASGPTAFGRAALQHQGQ